MTQSVADRIQIRMNELGLKQADLMRDTGAARGTVSGWVNGSNSPSAKHIESLAKALQTTSAWLLSGKESTQSKRDGVPIGQVKFTGIDDWDSDTPLEADEVEIVFYKDFKMACGHGTENDVSSDEKRRLRMSRATLDRRGIYQDSVFAATAEDDSMRPTIKDGDTVFVDTRRNKIKDGKIFAIEHGGLYKIKRLYNLPFGGVRIVSDNAEEFDEIQLTAQQIEEQQFIIIGWIWQVTSMEWW